MQISYNKLTSNLNFIPSLRANQMSVFDLMILVFVFVLLFLLIFVILLYFSDPRKKFMKLMKFAPIMLLYPHSHCFKKRQIFWNCCFTWRSSWVMIYCFSILTIFYCFMSVILIRRICIKLSSWVKMTEAQRIIWIIRK